MIQLQKELELFNETSSRMEGEWPATQSTASIVPTQSQRVPAQDQPRTVLLYFGHNNHSPNSALQQGERQRFPLDATCLKCISSHAVFWDYKSLYLFSQQFPEGAIWWT